ncbi:MAG: hypothetical protein LCH41_14085 [Armatimonadetes bacterium]|nr:hypothetical protein [Armatimonadota bacterium]
MQDAIIGAGLRLTEQDSPRHAYSRCVKTIQDQWVAQYLETERRRVKGEIRFVAFNQGHMWFGFAKVVTEMRDKVFLAVQGQPTQFDVEYSLITLTSDKLFQPDCEELGGKGLSPVGWCSKGFIAAVPQGIEIETEVGLIYNGPSSDVPFRAKLTKTYSLPHITFGFYEVTQMEESHKSVWHLLADAQPVGYASPRMAS